MKIKINHLEKTEGHLDFTGALLDGDVASAKIITTEGVRLMEAILTGRPFPQAPIIAARICGICPVVHALNIIKAIESAFNFLPSAQTVKLRKLMEAAQIIQSHALHLYFFAAPDFYGISDDLKLVQKFPTQAKAAVNIRNFALKILEIVGGRAIHPINCEVGGFKVLPKKPDLIEILQRWERAMDDSLTLVDFAAKFRYPEFRRETNFMALTSLREYAFYEGKIKTSTGRKISTRRFGSIVTELQLPGLGAKRATYRGKSFMVGALARLNINNNKLNNQAKWIARKLDLKFPIYNTFYNILAQAIEILHFTEEAGRLLQDLSKTLRPEESFSEKLKLIAFANPRNKTTVGYSVMEAPRGILYDLVEINRDGLVTRANIITPTVMFLNNLEEDLAVYLPSLRKLPKNQRKLEIKKLIRAYDPCIACATH